MKEQPIAMSTDVTMPELGESVTEGTVTRWLKEIGDVVDLDEPLLEVSTDKVDTEIPSPVAGVVEELLFAEEDTVEVGAVLARVRAPGKSPAPLSTSAIGGSAISAESAERGVEAPVDGVERGVEVPVSSPEGRSSAATPPRDERASLAPEVVSSGSTVAMSRLRQIIASRMNESLVTSAQLTTVQEVDVTRIARLRQRVKVDFERQTGVKLTFLPILAKAVIESLAAFPALNASISSDGKFVAYHDAVHLAVAVDTPRGLLVPVIRNANELGIGGLARRIADMAARARDNSVTPDELNGGTFTITNIGSVGALFDTPIINQPQVAILASGAVCKRPAVITGPDGDDQIAVRSMCYLPLTYDHRLVDGADAGRFLTAVRARLEAGAVELDLIA